jgi:hypothetical protein
LDTKIENNFYNKISPILNSITGLNSRDQFSVGLFLKLGVDFDFIQRDSIEPLGKPSNSREKSETLMSRLSAYVKQSDNSFQKSTAVNIKVSVGDADDLNQVVDLLLDPECLGLLAFIYLHEVQHILRKHNTTVFHGMMTSVIKSHKGLDFYNNLEENKVFQLINIAEDYSINYSLVQMLDDVGNTLSAEVKKSFLYSKGLYESKYIGLSEIEILKLILDDNEILKNLSNQYIGVNGRLGKSIEDLEDLVGKSVKSSSDSDKEIDALGESLQKIIDKQAGKGSFKLGKVIEKSIVVDVRWFDKLQQGLFNFVNKKTKHSIASWSNLDYKMKKIYKSPIRRNIKKTVDLIVSIDQSGSISYESLGKLLFLFEKKSRHIDNITMVFHDTDVVHVETFKGNFNYKDIIKAAKIRHAGGGTSHSCVFDWIDNNVSARDVSRKIYVSFSDNYSDIDSCYHNYKKIKKISKVWLNSEGVHVDKSIPGVKVNFS